MLLGNYWQVTGKEKLGKEYQTYFLTDSTHGLNGCHKWLLSVIPDNESILDIGCGPGHVYEIFRLAGRHNPYLGIDIDPKNLEFAKSLFPGIQVRQTDCQFLPWEDNSFDNSVLFETLDSLPDFRKGLDEANRVSKKRIIIAFERHYSLTSESDKNCIGVTFPGDYLVRINKDKFLSYINSFGYLVNSGIIKDGELESYDYWTVNKFNV